MKRHYVNDQEKNESKHCFESNEWDVKNSVHVWVKKKSFWKYALRLPAGTPTTQQQKTTMGITKMGKGNNANGTILPKFKGRCERISKRSWKKKKHLKRNAPKSQILIKVYFNCIHRLLYAAYGLNKNSR